MKPCGERDKADKERKKKGEAEEEREDDKSSSRVSALRMLHAHIAVLYIL